MHPCHGPLVHKDRFYTMLTRIDAVVQSDLERKR